MVSTFLMISGLIALLFVPSATLRVRYVLTEQRGGGGDMGWGIVVECIHRCEIELKPNGEWKTRSGLNNAPGLPLLPRPLPKAWEV